MCYEFLIMGVYTEDSSGVLLHSSVKIPRFIDFVLPDASLCMYLCVKKVLNNISYGK